MYGDDTTYAERVFAAYPKRFRLIAPVDLSVPGAAERVARWATVPGAVGIRLLMVSAGRTVSPHNAEVVGAIRAAATHGLPVCIHCWGHLELLRALASAHPDVQFVLDHLGLAQPMAPPVPRGNFDDLPQVLDLAKHPNLALKLTGACTMSRSPFPFKDLWRPIGHLISRFGADRCMWGTDWTRAVELVSYADAVSAFRDHWPLQDSERESLMGGTAMRLFRWTDD